MKRMKVISWIMIFMAISTGSPAHTNFRTGQEKFSMIITEIMADPTPAQHLPEVEYVEIYNPGTQPVSLKGWSLRDHTGAGVINTEATAAPGEYLILCSSGSAAQLSPWGKTISVTRFPSLDNSGDLLVLEDASGTVIHAVEYRLNWHENKLKEEGGWSLEMRDITQPCSGDMRSGMPHINWGASVHPNGGTPGRANSIGIEIKGEPAFEALHSYAPDPQTLRVVLNKRIDESSVKDMQFFRLDPGNIHPVTINTVPPFYQELELKFDQVTDSNKVYELTITGIRECSNKLSFGRQVIKTALAAYPAPGNIRINEILFNPKPGDDDFIEIINTTRKSFDLSTLRIANRNSRGEISSMYPLSLAPRLIFPGEYRAFSTAAASLQLRYLVEQPASVLQLNAMPSFPNDKGAAIILNDQGTVLDELQYTEKWHHPLVKDPAGISLERIYADQETQQQSNWQSAASSAGYATPGYRNSQNHSEQVSDQFFSIPDALFAPDDNGMNKHLFIHYQLPENSWIANVRVYHPDGWLVKTVAGQFLLGTKGFFRWDGTNNKLQPMGTGHYIIIVERFHPLGKTITWRKVVSLFRN